MNVSFKHVVFDNQIPPPPRFLTKKIILGRSMLEMLGVLAIIGILSIVGLVGFRLAMTYYKANETIHDVMLRATNVPMKWDNYEQRFDEKYPFPELLPIDENIVGYPVEVFAEPLASAYLIRVEVRAVPKAVCRRILNLEPTAVDLIQTGASGFVPDRKTIAKVDSCVESADMYFFFDNNWGHIEQNNPDNPDECTGLTGNALKCCTDHLCCNAPDNINCNGCQETLYDVDGCIIGCGPDMNVPISSGECCDGPESLCCALTEDCSACQPGPCCDNPDPCCGNDDPCCGSEDPCCGKTPPTCGNCEVTNDTCTGCIEDPNCCEPACNSDACMSCVDGTCQSLCTADQTCNGTGTCLNCPSTVNADRTCDNGQAAYYITWCHEESLGTNKCGCCLSCPGEGAAIVFRTSSNGGPQCCFGKVFQLKADNNGDGIGDWTCCPTGTTFYQVGSEEDWDSFEGCCSTEPICRCGVRAPEDQGGSHCYGGSNGCGFQCCPVGTKGYLASDLDRGGNNHEYRNACCAGTVSLDYECDYSDDYNSPCYGISGNHMTVYKCSTGWVW